MLNVDECGDVEAAWASGIELSIFKDEINVVRDLFIVLDHLRSLLVAI